MQNHFFFIFLPIIFTVSTYSQVGIGSVTPITSAALDITSISQVLLPPRITELQRNAISALVQSNI